MRVVLEAWHSEAQEWVDTNMGRQSLKARQIAHYSVVLRPRALVDVSEPFTTGQALHYSGIRREGR